MTLPYEDFIRQNFDVVSTSGVEFVCKCPWHDDRNKPNLYINGRRGLYICHACLAKGHLSRLGSTNILPTVRLGDLHRRVKDLKEALELEPVKRFTDGEDELLNYEFPCDYWTNERRFTKSVIKAFKLGYDPLRDVATIPLFDTGGELVGVLTRALDGSIPKYRQPRGLKKSLYLYGIDKFYGDDDHKGCFAITEGPLDAVACWDAGVPAVAMMGSHLSREQADIILASGAWRVVTMTDNDEAGRRALTSIVDNLPGIQVAVGMYDKSPRAKDPGGMKKTQIQAMYKGAVPWYACPYQELAELRYGRIW